MTKDMTEDTDPPADQLADDLPADVPDDVRELLTTERELSADERQRLLDIAEQAWRTITPVATAVLQERKRLRNLYILAENAAGPEREHRMRMFRLALGDPA